jgi:hypothetical protein
VNGSGGVVAGSNPPRPTHRADGLDPCCPQCAQHWLHIVNQPKVEPGKRRAPVLLPALFVFLFFGSPLAGGIAAAVADGWAVPMWLGGWLLAIVIPLGMAVFS